MKPDFTPLRARLVLEEALKLKPYKDTKGYLTIGIGRCLDTKGITVQEAYMLLDNDLEEKWDELVKALSWVDTLDQPRQRVLLDMSFNLGVDGLLKFPNMLALVQSGKYSDAAQHMRESLWAKQVGSRATNLAQIMESGHE